MDENTLNDDNISDAVTRIVKKGTSSSRPMDWNNVMENTKDTPVKMTKNKRFNLVTAMPAVASLVLAVAIGAALILIAANSGGKTVNSASEPKPQNCSSTTTTDATHLTTTSVLSPQSTVVADGIGVNSNLSTTTNTEPQDQKEEKTVTSSDDPCETTTTVPTEDTSPMITVEPSGDDPIQNPSECPPNSDCLTAQIPVQDMLNQTLANLKIYAQQNNGNYPEGDFPVDILQKLWAQNYNAKTGPTLICPQDKRFFSYVSDKDLATGNIHNFTVYYCDGDVMKKKTQADV